MLLFSDNDLAAIQTAIDGRFHIEMTRIYKDLTVKVTTARASPAWRPWLWIARLEIWRGPVYSTRWCVSSEEVRRYASE